MASTTPRSDQGRRGSGSLDYVLAETLTGLAPHAGHDGATDPYHPE